MNTYTVKSQIVDGPTILFSKFLLKSYRLNSAKNCAYYLRAPSIQGRPLFETLRVLKKLRLSGTDIMHISRYNRLYLFCMDVLMKLASWNISFAQYIKKTSVQHNNSCICSRSFHIHDDESIYVQRPQILKNTT